MKIHLIAALDENFGIGWQGKLPWHLPDDLQHFKAITLGHCILMGRKTWNSIGRPLPGRTNLVLSQTVPHSPESVHTFANFDDACNWAQVHGESDLFVIGGGEVFRHSLQFADQLDLTRVHTRANADVFFPRFDTAIWQCVEKQPHPADERHLFAFIFETWQHVTAP